MLHRSTQAVDPLQPSLGTRSYWSVSVTVVECVVDPDVPTIVTDVVVELLDELDVPPPEVVVAEGPGDPPPPPQLCNINPSVINRHNAANL